MECFRPQLPVSVGVAVSVGSDLAVGGELVELEGEGGLEGGGGLLQRHQRALLPGRAQSGLLLF